MDQKKFLPPMDCLFKVLSKLLPGLESGRTGNGGRGVTGEHLQVSFFPPEAR